MSQPIVASGVATAAGPTSIPNLVGSAADLNQAASGRQLGNDKKPQERAAETASPEPASTPAPAAPAAATPPAEKPRFSEEIINAAKAFGVDISGFTDDANAQHAINLAITHAASLGARPQQQQQQQPQAEVPTEDEETDDEIDFAALDPKTAAYVRKQQELANKAVQVVQELERQQLAERQAAAEQHYKTLVDRARNKIDSLKSADFGVGDNITYPQQLQRKNLMDTAASIILGRRAMGGEIEVEDAINAALTILGKKPGAEAAPGPKSLQPGSIGPGGKLAPAQPYFGKVRPAYDLTGVTSDPNMQRGLAEIFGRKA